jgi:ABC-type polysaccharide/polyol phosphate export permease
MAMKIKKLKKKLTRISIKTLSIVEKNLQMKIRFKFDIVVMYLTYFISILMPIIVFGKLFQLEADVGPWNSSNYIIFVFLGYNILLMSRMIKEVPSQQRIEKFLKTHPALMLAPFNRFYLLFGYHFSELILVLPPFFVFLIVSFFFYPISLLTVLIICFMFFAISIIFTSIGFIIGAFAISNENIWAILGFFVNMVVWASCITYPYELFPHQIQFFINFNPIYFIIDILRLTWIENNFLLTIQQHPEHFIIFFISLAIFPLIGVITFNYVYKKLGISGY